MAQKLDFLTSGGNLTTGAITAWDNQQGFQIALHVQGTFFTGMSGFRGRAINITNGTTILMQFMAYDGGDGNCYFYCRNATPANYGDAHSLAKSSFADTTWYTLLIRLDEVGDVWRTAIFEDGNTTAIHDVTRTSLYQTVPTQTGNYIELNVANAVGVEDFVWSCDLLAAYDHDHAVSSADASAKPDLADSHVIEVWAMDPDSGSVTGEQSVTNATVAGTATTDYDESTGLWDYAAAATQRNGQGIYVPRIASGTSTTTAVQRNGQGLRVARVGASAGRTISVVRNAEFVHPPFIGSGTRSIGGAARNGQGIRVARIGSARRQISMARRGRGIYMPFIATGTSSTSAAGATVRNARGLLIRRIGHADRNVAMSRNALGMRVVRIGSANPGAQSTSGFASFASLTTYPATTSTPGSAVLIVFKDQPNRLELAGLKDADGAFLNSESLTVTFQDVDDASITTPMAMTYKGASNGVYTLDTAANVPWQKDRNYRALIRGDRIEQTVRLRCKERGTV